MLITESEKNMSNDLNGYIRVIRIPVLFATILCFSYCGSTSTDSYSNSNMNEVMKTSPLKNSFQYDLNNPDEKYNLLNSLKEISGLAYYKEEKILCIQDEKATIYSLDLVKNEIVNRYRFGQDGDFEDIAVEGQTAYLIRSDGHIFEIKNFDQEDYEITDHNTPLSGKNDIEGVAYDKSSNSLLLGCKGSPEIGKEKRHKGFKAVYGFSLDNMKLNKEPAFLISKKDLDSFQPSGLAINPISDQIFVISSSGKTLVVLGRNGKIEDIHKLNPDLFRQPEGICFSPAGELFISNEGSGGEGNILKFKLHK
jgi:uncharacterized protein YjiK